MGIDIVVKKVKSSPTSFLSHDSLTISFPVVMLYVSSGVYAWRSATVFTTAFRAALRNHLAVFTSIWYDRPFLSYMNLLRAVVRGDGRTFGQTCWRFICSRWLYLTLATGARNITEHSICCPTVMFSKTFSGLVNWLSISIQPATKRCNMFMYLLESVQFSRQNTIYLCRPMCPYINT